MKMICLDLEGVLIPEIWIEFAKKTGHNEFLRTTRDEPDYDKLMGERIELLRKYNLRLKDIQNVIDTMPLLDGASRFLSALRDKAQVTILSDTFSEFAYPFMKKLDFPSIFCNSLTTDNDGFVVKHNMRLQNGKKKAIDAFRTLNFETFASGDSYNDLEMIKNADDGALFMPPSNIVKENPNINAFYNYDDLLKYIFR